MHEALILGAFRTPRARKQGKFAAVHPVDLLAFPLQAVLEKSAVCASQIEDVIIGCVTQSGEQGGCIARRAILAAGWPDSIPGATVNRLCGSGQQALNWAAQGIMAGAHELVIAGGLEHMTRAPMFSDMSGPESSNLRNRYANMVHQGLAAEAICEKFGFSREELDEFALSSQTKAKRAAAEGRFKPSLVPVPYALPSGESGVLAEDDNPRPKTSLEALSGLKPAFKEGGKITAGNASAIVDAAAALLIGSAAKAKELSLKPLARIVSMALCGSDPELMLTGPLQASRMALKKAGLSVPQIDIWEINEAFAPVPLLVMRELEIELSKVNPNGGAISLGHPLGASGAILVNTAADELQRTGARYALITMCTGLGMGIATIIERI